MEPFDLMQFYENVYSRDTSYCALCFRSGEDVTLKVPLVFRKVLGALKYLNSFQNENICYMCESRAAAVCRFLDMIQLALEIQMVFQKSLLSKGKNRKKLAVEGVGVYQSAYTRIRNKNQFICTQVLHVDAVTKPEDDAHVPNKTLKSTSKEKIKKPPPDDTVVIEDDSSEDVKELTPDVVQTEPNQTLNMPFFYQMLPVNTVLPHGVYLISAPPIPNPPVQTNDPSNPTTVSDNPLLQKIPLPSNVPINHTSPIENTRLNHYSLNNPKTPSDDNPSPQTVNTLPINHSPKNLKTCPNRSPGTLDTSPKNSPPILNTATNHSAKTVKTTSNNCQPKKPKPRLQNHSPEPINHLHRTPKSPDKQSLSKPTVNSMEPHIPLTTNSPYDNPPTNQNHNSEDNCLIRTLLLRPANPPKPPKTLKLQSSEQSLSQNSGPAKKRQKHSNTEVIDDDDDDVEIITWDLDDDEAIKKRTEIEDKVLSRKESKVDWEEIIPVGVIGFADEDTLPGRTIQDATKDLLNDLQNVINMNRTE